MLSVSLSSIASKLMERILRDSIMYHLVRNSLIANEQHGFVSNKSCLTNQLVTLDSIFGAQNPGFTSVIVFMNFSKAFDKLSHRVLIKKLELYGFNLRLVIWINNFLSDSKQIVVMGDAVSNWLDVFSGVHYGSLLGLNLRLIFVINFEFLISFKMNPYYNLGNFYTFRSFWLKYLLKG